MLILILLLFFPIPEQNNRIIINTGIPGAEFYLDANFVAAMDKNGTLTMENVPAGSFSFSIKKKGYKPYNSSFKIGEGESILLKPALEKIKGLEKSDRPSTAGVRSGKTTGIPPGKGETRSPVPQMPTAATRPVSEPLMKIPQDESSESSALPVLALLCAIGLLSFGIWIWKRKGEVSDIPAVDPDFAEPEAQKSQDQQDQSNNSNRPEPPFIEELKRREELLKAGFVGSRPRSANQESSQEKEVVIVLPKEAFRYEEDK